MNGYKGYVGSCLDFGEQNCFTKQYIRDDIGVYYSPLSKFDDDKLFIESEDYFLLLDGVILNKDILLKKYQCSSFSDLNLNLIKKKGRLFFKEYQGSYSGVLYDKKLAEIHLFVDPIGSRLVYYSKVNNLLLFSTSIVDMKQMRTSSNASNKLDMRSAYCMLTYGYLIEDLSYIDSVCKLRAGEIVSYQLKSEFLHREFYFRYNVSSTNTLNIDEVLDGLYVHFVDAVRLQVTKNKEYGYLNYAPLSAGLDSRITTWTVHDLIKKAFVSFSYSQTGYFDEITPKQIVGELRNHWLFKPLDNGISLYNIDEVVKINGGIAINYAACQVYDMISLMNTEHIGLIHTGMLGDKVINTWYTPQDYMKPYTLGMGANSKILLDKLKEQLADNFFSHYEHAEQAMHYIRGFSGANMGSPIIFQNYTESFSPFCNHDFLCYSLNIPVELRYKRSFYYKWVIEKFPEAAKYPHNGHKIIPSPLSIKYNGYQFSYFEYLYKGMRKILSAKSSLERVQHMNPIGYWYQSNKDLHRFLDKYFEDIVRHLPDNTLIEDCKSLYYRSGPIERDLVLTLLSAYKLIFCK